MAEVGPSPTGDPPLVSVVVPVLNGERTIGALLRALAAQQPVESSRLGRRGHELIVVDNGSTDGTRELLESSAVPDLVVLHEARRGPSAARNRGLNEARGSIVAFVDADCVPSRGWLRELTAAFEDPETVICAGGLASFPARTAAQRFAASYGLNDATRTLQMPQMPFANTRNMAVLREAAVAVGGLPEDLIGGEDVEFSYLIRQRYGSLISYRPNALVFHQDREDDESLRLQAMSYGRSMAVLYARHPDMLRWGPIERMRRFRTGTLRRVSARAHEIARRLGRGDERRQEFARYLAFWTEWFWRGFDEARRGSQAGQ